MLASPKYESYKDSGVQWIGQLPSHWKIRRNLGLFDERKEVNQPDMELLSVTIDKGVIKQSEIATKKDSSNEDKSKYKVVRKGDLAYNKMRMWQGAIGMSDYDGIVSPAYIILNTRNQLYSRYFHYLYRTESFIREADRHSYGLCSDMNSLRYEDFKTIYSPVPPEQEVGKIVDFLDRTTTDIDRAIAQKQRLIELLQEQKAILINQAVTKGLNPNVSMKDSGIDAIGEIPKHWVVCRVKHIVKTITKGTTPSTEGKGFSDTGIRYFKAENIFESQIVLEPEFFIDERTNCLLKRSQINEGDVLFVIAGATIGKTAVVHEGHIPANTNQAVSLIRPSSKVRSGYLHLWLQSNYVENLLRVSSVQSAQPNIAMEDLGNIEIPLSALEEQDQIIKSVTELSTPFSEMIDTQKKAIESLIELKSIFIANAVTGKIKA